MNQKELSEIRRRIRPDHNNIRRIYGCYVNTNREIISEFEESVGILSGTEAEIYFNLLKKTLSGALGNIPHVGNVIKLLSDGLQTNLNAQNIAWFLRQALQCRSRPRRRQLSHPHGLRHL